MSDSNIVGDLNQAAWQACQPLLQAPQRFGVTVQRRPCGAAVVDCGVEAPGGIEAGLILARTCLADLAAVTLEGPPQGAAWGGPHIAVRSDHPVAACLGAQYAGWKIEGEKFFAMGSGPMRALWAGEALVQSLQLQQSAALAVGVLECSRPPHDAVCRHIAQQCRVAPEQLTLLAARTGSIAGGLQIAARSLETALHKLHELDFDVRQVVAGWGLAPAPPCGPDDLQAIGWTNDAILYGGQVCLWLDADDQSLLTVGDQLPSSASSDYGRPFAEIFADYGHDFYRVDPHLFSPAQVTLINRRSGGLWVCGQLNPSVLRNSFSSSLG